MSNECWGWVAFGGWLVVAGCSAGPTFAGEQAPSVDDAASPGSASRAMVGTSDKLSADDPASSERAARAVAGTCDKACDDDAASSRSDDDAASRRRSSQAVVGSCDKRTTLTWRTGSEFSVANSWFKTASRDRVWLTDVDGNGVADMVGIAFDGTVLVATGTGTSFNPAVSWGVTRFNTPDNWFTRQYRQRVWVTDVTNDGKADVVGVDDYGTIYFYRNTGSGFVEQPSRASIFTPYASRVGGGWFDPPDSANPNSGTRVWLADVTGDRITDVVGISDVGEIYVALGSATGFEAPIGPFSSVFTEPGGWFNSTYQDRIWVADVDGDGISDLMGLANDGQIYVSLSKWRSIGGFDACRAVGSPTIFKTSTHWLDRTSLSRIWVGDVTGDHRADIVGIAPPGQGDGDVWVARSKGNDFVQKPWLMGSVFKSSDTVNQWFTTSHSPRIWLSDVSGDGRADLVGVAPNGDVWMARSGSDSAGGFFLPSLRVASSSMTSSSDLFGTDTTQRVWLADVTGDAINDFVSVSPNGADGTVGWTQVLPTAVTAISSVTPSALDVHSRTVSAPIFVSFSRALDCLTLPTSALTVAARVGTGAETALSVSKASAPGLARSCAFNVVFNRVASGTDLKVYRSVNGHALTDRWQPSGSPARSIDGNGNGFLDCGTTDRADRVDYDTAGLVGGAAKVALDYDYAGAPPPRFPAATEPPVIPFSTLPGAPPPMGRVVLVGNNGSQVLVLISVELIGVNPGRLRDLIAARTGIPPQNVIVTATHAHSVFHTLNIYSAASYDDRSWQGPRPTYYDYPGIYPYLQWVEDNLAEQVTNQFIALNGVTVGVGTTTYGSLHMPVNRRDASAQKREIKAVCGPPTVDFDDTLGVIGIYAGSNPLALLVNYGMHPVVLPAATGMTTDFPGFMSQCIEQGGCTGLPTPSPRFPVGMFLQSGAGDIDPSEIWTGNERLSRGYGRLMAQRAYEVSNGAGFLKSTAGMRVRVQRTVHELQGVSSCNNVQGCSTEEPRSDGTNVTWEPESTAVVIGTPSFGAAPGTPLVAFGTAPGESFTGLEEQLRTGAATGSAKTFLLGYANGYYGYLPNKEAVDCVDALVASNGPGCRANQPLGCSGAGAGFGNFACYGSAQCSDDSGNSYATGPTFLKRGADGSQTAGEQIVSQDLASLNALLH